MKFNIYYVNYLSWQHWGADKNTSVKSNWLKPLMFHLSLNWGSKCILRVASTEHDCTTFWLQNQKLKHKQNIVGRNFEIKYRFLCLFKLPTSLSHTFELHFILLLTVLFKKKSPRFLLFPFMSSPVSVAELGVAPVALARHDIDTAGLSSKALMT